MDDRPDETESADFAAILAAYEHKNPEAQQAAAPKLGEKVSGRIVSIGEEAAFVDLGAKAEGTIDLAELKNEAGELTVAPGDTVEAVITACDDESGQFVLRVKPGRGGGEDLSEIRQAYEHEVPVEGHVFGFNKGGLEVKVAGIRAFCPMSQIEMGFVKDPASYAGQRLTFRIIRLEEGGRGRRPNIVLSRRVLLEEEAKGRAAEARERLQPGTVISGKVTSLTRYGAFVDLGGVEGLLHVSEMSHSRVGHPKEMLAVGDEVEVQVIKLEEGKDADGSLRISLSRLPLLEDPWHGVAARYPEGSRVKGRVLRLQSFGAFVELEPGLEGLVHVSELGANKRVEHPKEVVQPGQEVEVTVLKVDAGKRRLSLSMSEEAAVEATPGEQEKWSSSGAGSFGSLGDILKAALKDE